MTLSPKDSLKSKKRAFFHDLKKTEKILAPYPLPRLVADGMPPQRMEWASLTLAHPASTRTHPWGHTPRIGAWRTHNARHARMCAYVRIMHAHIMPVQRRAQRATARSNGCTQRRRATGARNGAFQRRRPTATATAMEKGNGCLERQRFPMNG